MHSYNTILSQFNAFLGIDNWQPSTAYRREYERICINVIPLSLSNEQKKEILRITIVDKLDIYKEYIQNLIDECALNSYFFNYIEKTIITESLIKHDSNPFCNIMKKKGVSRNEALKLIKFDFLSFNEIILYLHRILNIENKSEAIITAIFSKYIYLLFPIKEIQLFYSQANIYKESYYDFLKEEYPLKYERKNSLSFLHITNALFNKYYNYNDFLSSICSFIKKQYNELQNHCYLSIMIDDISNSKESIQWRLYSDIVLFAEKFIEEKIKLGYFHPEKIADQTKKYIEELNITDCQFDICNGGFTYKDCIIISNEYNLNKIESDSVYSILLLLQKNYRDEDIVPCPACRSYNVRGNSYPIIGVKSWECHNIYCPDKSKYNRGKRYSFSQIIKQEAIMDIKSQIPKHILDDWKLDVVSRKTIRDIVEYLIFEYSFFGDRVSFYNVDIAECIIEGRIINKKEYNEIPNSKILNFFNSCYFKRFLVDKKVDQIKLNNIGFKNHEVYNDDCINVLASIQPNSIDGAVTSPPYYNAREYSHWDNIYCYLYDIYNHARLLYNTLKPGTYYLFNIFDYFDNENNVVFSLMGKKRMILGAYIIYIFRYIGFELQQNIIWYKGQIQGHRNTNQGNFSPYYQSPLNCYEHIFCFKKANKENESSEKFPYILNSHPVVKMVNGKNIIGHTAPYPESIPNLLCRKINTGKILDCYSGSFTTARVAEKNNLNSINIEINEDYCNLGKQLLLNVIRNFRWK